MSYQPKVYRKLGGDTLVVASGGTIEKQAGSIEIEQAVATKAANYTVVAADSGCVFYATVADLVFTLPATAAGLSYKFIAGAVGGATLGLSISPVAADKLTGRGVATPADDKDLINTGATDVVGDSVTIVGDGVDGWYIVDSEGTWAREA